MSEKLTQEAIEEMVDKAKAQTERMIETMLRRVVADFESADSEDFKLVLTIEGERKRGGGQMTLQTKAQSTVDLKRKDQTQADVIDWGPTLFDQPADTDIPKEEPEEEPRGPKLLCSASPVFDGTVVDAEFTVSEAPVDTPPDTPPAEDGEPEDVPPEDDEPEDGDPEEEEPENEQPTED